MGKRRGDGQRIFTKARKARQSKIKKMLKRRTRLNCPICLKAEMFVEIRRRKGLPPLYLIGCLECNVGDMMPWHPVWTYTDMYNFVADFWREPRREPPIFRYVKLRRSVLNYFLENITYGKIEVQEVIEDMEG